jgi:hypothetical protein
MLSVNQFLKAKFVCARNKPNALEHQDLLGKAPNFAAFANARES